MSPGRSAYAAAMLGEQGLLKIEPRGGITPADMELVAKMRSCRAGWAGCAKAIGRSEPDTREACDPTYTPLHRPRLTVVEAPDVPERAPVTVHGYGREPTLAKTVMGGSKEHQLLMLLHDHGPCLPQVLADESGRSLGLVRSSLYTLIGKGFVIHRGDYGSQFQTTRAGRDELDRLARMAGQ